MSAPQLYQSISARIQCCKVGEFLFVRTWNYEEERKGKWARSTATAEELRAWYESSKGDDRRDAGCRLHCLTQYGPGSIWFVESAQACLDREITALRERFKPRIEKELDDDFPTVEALDL